MEHLETFNKLVIANQYIKVLKQTNKEQLSEIQNLKLQLEQANNKIKETLINSKNYKKGEVNIIKRDEKVLKLITELKELKNQITVLKKDKDRLISNKITQDNKPLLTILKEKVFK